MSLKDTVQVEKCAEMVAVLQIIKLDIVMVIIVKDINPFKKVCHVMAKSVI